MEFDAARVVVLAGDPGDVVARFPGVVCVARCPEPELLRRLLRLCAEAAGPDPGRALARSLARWLASEDDLPDRIVFGTVSTAGDQLAVFLSGATAVEIDSTVLSGTDAAAWTDRLLPTPGGPVRLALQGASARTGAVPDVLDLRGGVVPGAGAVLVTGSSAAPPRPMAPPAEARAPQFDPRRYPPPVERSPLAPDPAPLQRPPGNGVAPAVDVRKPATPPQPQQLAPPTPPSVPAAVAVPQAPERPDEPGSDEEFTSGEWFGAAGTPEQGEATQGADDRPSPWIAPPASGAAQKSAQKSAQQAVPPPGRHAVHRPLEQTEESDGLAASADEPPTPRDGDALVSATVAAVPDARSAEQSGPSGSSTPGAGEQSESRSVPAPRSAPSDQPATVAVASRNGHQNGESAVAGAEQVQGRECPRGHLNDPRSQQCSQCGARLDERAALVTGARPALGRLVFDDGASYTVDAEYLVGRMPESDERVSGGELRSIVVEDRSGAVSRVHAEVRIDGWDVMLADSGSRNGTFVAGPTQQGWSPLPPGKPRRLVPGTRVRMGGRTFVFETPGGAGH